MNHKRIALALISAVTFFSSVDFAFARVEASGFDGTRAGLREFCQKQHGEIIEGHKRTTCITVVGGLEIVCRDNGRCTRRQETADRFEPSPNGGSLSSPGSYTPPKKKKEEK